MNLEEVISLQSPEEIPDLPIQLRQGERRGSAEGVSEKLLAGHPSGLPLRLQERLSIPAGVSHH